MKDLGEINKITESIIGAALDLLIEEKAWFRLD
jgi:hypothetical protein